MDKLRVLFVWPKNEGGLLSIPLGFAYLFGNCLDEQFKFGLIDCVLDHLSGTDPEFINRVTSFSPSVLAVSGSSSNFSETQSILQAVKKLDRKIVTIVGGPHVTACGPQVIEQENIDFLFLGEAEIGFKQFLKSLSGQSTTSFAEIQGLVYRDKDGACHFSEPARIENLDALSLPDYDAVNIDRYIEAGSTYLSTKERCAPIYCTRGCPYHCKFCSVPSISGRTLRRHSVPYLIDNIKYLYERKKIRGFNVVDDNFTFDIEFAKEFCRQVIASGFEEIEFNSPNGIRMQRGDSELWTLMKHAGWQTITVAPESGSQRVLQLMGKELDLSPVPGIIADMKKAGLLINGFFMSGYPGETEDDLRETEKFIKTCGFDNVYVASFQPMPGTQIYEELVANGTLCTHHLPGYFGTTEHIKAGEMAGFRLTPPI